MSESAVSIDKIAKIKNNALRLGSLNTDCLYMDLVDNYTEAELNDLISLSMFNCQINIFDNTENIANICPKLRTLVLDNVKIKKIIIPENVEILNIYECEIEIIEFTQETKITSIEIDSADLREINLNNCTNLTEITITQTSLPTLDINLEKLQSLNINGGGTTNITLDCPNLANIDISNNPLKIIDLSNCPKLIKCSLGYNLLSTVDILDNNKLRILNICENKIKSIDNIIGLYSSNLLSLNIKKNKFKINLEKFSANMTRLRRLYIDRNQFTTHLDIRTEYDEYDDDGSNDNDLIDDPADDPENDSADDSADDPEDNESNNGETAVFGEIDD